MKSSMALTTRLSTESEYKSLYSWFLQEYNAAGEEVGSPVVPWTFSFYFEAGEIERQHSVNGDDHGDKPAIRETNRLKCKLKSVRGEFDRPVRFSIFGTGRPIVDLTLEIYSLGNDTTEERCHVGASQAFDYEPDFPTIPSYSYPDSMYFVAHVEPERFERILDALGRDGDARLSLMVRNVPGLYAVWSPDIVTSSVKVLPRGRDYAPQVPEGCEIVAPVLDKATEFSLTVQRIIKPEPASTPELDDLDEEHVPKPPQAPSRSEETSGLGTQKQLAQIKHALWIVAFLLLLVVIFKH